MSVTINNSVTATSAVNNYTLSYNAGSGSNRILIVVVGYNDNNYTPSTATYAGQAMTVLTQDSGAIASVELFYLVDPASGTNNLNINFSASDPMYVHVCYADGAGSIGTITQVIGDSNTPSISITPQRSDSLLLAGIVNDTGGTDLVPGSGVTQISDTSGQCRTAIFTKPATSTSAHTINGTSANDDWTIIAIELKVPQDPPTVALNTTDATEFEDETPTLEFTGTDPESNDVSYQVQIDTVNTFDSQSTNLISQTTHNSLGQINGDGGTAEAQGQSFVPGSTTSITAVEIYLSRTGSPTDGVTVSILSGSATGTLLGSGSIADANIVNASGNLVALSSPVDVTSGNTYYLTITRNGARDTLNRYNTRYNGTSVISGDRLEKASGSWTQVSGDLYIVLVSVQVLLNKLSGTDAGFVNTVNGGDTDPFTSGQKVSYTVQAGDALADGTYYWRARATDPSGSATYGAWSTVRSFTISVGVSDTLLTVQDALHGHIVSAVTITQANTLVVQDALHGHSVESPGVSAHSNLTIQDSFHAHTVQNATLAVDSLLVIQNALHAHTVDHISPTQNYVLSINDALHAHTVENAVLTPHFTLVIQDALHGHSVDALTLTQQHTLAVQDALHGHMVDNLDIGLSLTIQDALHAHSVDAVGLTQQNTLAIDDSSHQHLADSLALVQQNTLAIQNALHAHTAENLVLVQDTLLTIQDSFHAHSVDSVSVTQANQLQVQDALHDHLVVEIAIIQAHDLEVDSALHAHAVDSVGITQANLLVAQDALHTHTVDSIGVTQNNVLAVQESLHAHSVDNIETIQNHVLQIQDALHNHTAENIPLFEGVTLEIDDALHTQSVDSVVVTQANTLVVQDAVHAHIAENTILSEGFTLTIQDAVHAHTADQPAPTQDNYKIHTLVDSFNTGHDTDVWQNFTGQFDGGFYKIPTSPDGIIHALTSIDHFDLTESEIFVQIVDAGDFTGAHYARLELWLTGSNRVYWAINAALGGAKIEAYKQVGGSFQSVRSDTVYDPTVHKFFRIRHTAGTIYYDYSTDAISWTNHASTTVPFDLTDLQVKLTSQTTSAGVATTSIFDNINVASISHNLLANDALHAHTADNATLGITITLEINDALHAHLVDNVGITQANILEVDSALHAHTADSTTPIQGSILEIADSFHDHTVEQSTLTQQNLLAIQDTLHAHSADNLDLNQANQLAIQDALHNHAVDTVGLIQHNQLLIDSTLHDHTVDSTVLVHNFTLEIQDSLHAHTVDSVEVEFNAAPVLTIQDALHAHTADHIQLSQHFTLEIQDSLHAHSADSVSVSQAHVLTIQDALHAHTATEPELIFFAVLEVQDALHLQLAESPQLQQHSTLEIQDSLHTQSAESPTPVPNITLAIQDSTHGHHASAIVVYQQHILAVADALHIQNVENLTIEQLLREMLTRAPWAIVKPVVAELAAIDELTPQAMIDAVATIAWDALTFYGIEMDLYGDELDVYLDNPTGGEIPKLNPTDPVAILSVLHQDTPVMGIGEDAPRMFVEE